MTRRIRLFAVLLVLAAISAGGMNHVEAARPFHATRSDPALESWRWRTFHELEGKGATCLTEGPDGSVYFGTDEGVRVCNGVRWGLFGSEDGITGAPVNTLLRADDGSVYAGTETSLLKLNGTSWETVFPPEGNLHWRFTDLEEARDGSIWAATNWGALRIKGPEAHLYTTDGIGRAVRAIAPYVRLRCAL
jgi:ligand-binding sensor domain-containing protein